MSVRYKETDRKFREKTTNKIKNESEKTESFHSE